MRIKTLSIAIAPKSEGATILARIICKKSCMSMTPYCSKAFQKKELVTDLIFNLQWNILLNDTKESSDDGRWVNRAPFTDFLRKALFIVMPLGGEER
nr:hypothetical protein [uncultured Porphyromonas sp.]